MRSIGRHGGRLEREGGPVDRGMKKNKPIDAATRLQHLAQVYYALLADIEKRGAIYEAANGQLGKNPSVALLVSISAHMRRLQNDLALEDPQEFDPMLRDLHRKGQFMKMRCGDPNCGCAA